ncbi:glycosyl transferase [Paractinoplanes rishiriensis]|uniref:Glycosyl transferase n=1 Tax=Paractinoplanes rishiriensis TaxID=1050105 RepID=A0A919MSU6_9ACTN|nr:glycosyl transferase [Actinoplanes rishiriensis]
MLHVISALAEGGPEHQLRLLVRRLPHESEVVTLSPPGAVAAALRAAGVRVHEVSARHDLAAVGPLRRLIRRGRFDLVHAHAHRACLAGRFAARLAGVPCVVATEHHLDPDAPAGRLYLAGERLGRVTIAATPAVAGRLRACGVPDGRVTVIPKAVAAEEFRYDPGLRHAVRDRLGIAPDAPVVGGVGRLEPGERFDRLIRAVAEVPGAVLLLVGDGSARTALERLAEIEGIADRVRFAGAVGHPRAMLSAMDVFASPGDHTFGLVVLEAIAAGLPALYARCTPLEELAEARAAVGGSRRLTPHDRESLPRQLRAELLCLAERHFARLPPRTAGRRYDADHQAAAVARVYACASRPSGRALGHRC